MELLDLIQRGALLTMLALTTRAQDLDADAFVSIDGTDDVDVLATAQGLWLVSERPGDERQLLVGDFVDDEGEAALSMIATLIPDAGVLASGAEQRGRMYGELRLAGGAVLGNAVGELLQSAPSAELAVGLAGRWKVDAVGVGRFEAVVYAQRGEFATAVPIAVMRGTYSIRVAGAESAGEGGDPLKIESPGAAYSPLLSAENGFSAVNPFSVPPPLRSGGRVHRLDAEHRGMTTRS